ncbi:hypothetical protein C8J57DRAFT_1526721 [Mycena rebaudengoi]|nr:hypothetical protein C8J57DRAFT_1526721 [Mycena rebaudengoi]
MLRRRRSAGALVGTTGSAPTPGVPAPMPLPPSTTSAAAVPPPVAPAATANNTANTAPTHRLRLVPHLDSRRSLRFDPIARAQAHAEDWAIAFKSKVVSRAHAEVWVEGASGGGGVKFDIRDTKSSSGTFLNHVRLSRANTESRPHQIKDGDILQGGAEDIYKSVKIRIELGREWQAGVNAFK